MSKSRTRRLERRAPAASALPRRRPRRVLVFIAYALGMGIVLMAVTLSAVLFQGAITRYLRGGIPYVQQVGALLLIVAGVYLVATEVSILTKYGALTPLGEIS